MVTFNDQVGTTFDASRLKAEIVQEIEQAVMSQIDQNPDLQYIKDLGQENFYWQIIDDGTTAKIGSYGVLLIIPQNEIRDQFYTELGGGLRIPAQYLTNFNTPWTNDGEIISFVLRKKDLKMTAVNNWRFRYDPLEEKEEIYYAPLKIFVQDEEAASKGMTIKHFVDEEFRSQLEGNQEFELQLPKGRVSAIAFYIDDELKGVLCFNLWDVRYPCAMDYATSVSFGENTMHEKILYAEPCCCEKYSLIFLEGESFEDLSQIHDWIEEVILEPEIVSSRSQEEETVEAKTTFSEE